MTCSYLVVLVDAAYLMRRSTNSAGFSEALALMPYNEQFHQIRALLRKELSNAAVQKYWTLLEGESRKFVKSAAESPSQLEPLTRQCVLFPARKADSFIETDLLHEYSYSGSVILKVTYGYQTQPTNDPFLVLAKQVMNAFSEASQPGAWLVDLIPSRTSCTGCCAHLFTNAMF